MTPELFSRRDRSPDRGHGHGHGHGHFDGPAPVGPTAARVVVGLLAAIAIAVVAGAVLLWPNKQQIDIPLPFQNAGGGAVTTEAGTVVAQDIAPCG
ncbi:YibE/F family protein, partial [Rhodococcus hoagii]|nr:YibE/F family protein [Prescottella equi]